MWKKGRKIRKGSGARLALGSEQAAFEVRVRKRYLLSRRLGVSRHTYVSAPGVFLVLLR